MPRWEQYQGNDLRFSNRARTGKAWYIDTHGRSAGPKRELKWFTPREGGVEHVSADNPENAKDYIADWIAETFWELGAKGVRV